MGPGLLAGRGGIYLSTAAGAGGIELVLADSVVSDNKTHSDGGGIDTSGLNTDISMSDSTLSCNSASAGTAIDTQDSVEVYEKHHYRKLRRWCQRCWSRDLRGQHGSWEQRLWRRRYVHPGGHRERRRDDYRQLLRERVL